MTHDLKEKAHRLIDTLPAEKLVYVVAILTGMRGLMIDEEEPDEFDLLLLREIKDEHPFVSFEESLSKAGFSVNEL
ncbi:MAG: hypothetical protein LBK69_00125 [Syntrophomonadaceae bacterium]|jgi:hypothetical protein|nr:hypothetical protein [Syntrophomonadaceae bacterium]